jgi:uncharacterized protein
VRVKRRGVHLPQQQTFQCSQGVSSAARPSIVVLQLLGEISMAEPTVRGSFVWHELMTANVPAAVTYYQKVVGWKTQPFDANYLMWVAKSGPIGGVAALPAGQSESYWLPYIGTTDIAATLQQAEKLGGKVVTPATDIPNAGRYAVLADPQGATFGVHWSPKPMSSSGGPQPGHFSWQELATTDYKAAFAFYQALFGWEKTAEHDMGAMGIYFMYGLNGQALGGMFNKPPGMPTAWCCYAQVADARKAAKVAVKAGGKVLNGPMQVPGGSWIAQLADPQGGIHAVVSSEPMAATSPPAETKAAASSAVAVKKAGTRKAAKKKTAKKKKPAAASSKPVRKTAKKKSSKKPGKKTTKKVIRNPVQKKKLARKKLPAKKLKRTAKRKIGKKKSVAKKK